MIESLGRTPIGPEWSRALSRYRKPSWNRAMFELAVTAVPLCGLWATASASHTLDHTWFALLLTIPAAGFLVRLFMIQHDCGHGAFFPSKSANVPHAVLHALIAEYPRIGAAFWRDTLVDASVSREWLARIGAREAYGRLAHLFCELFMRLRVVGRTDDLQFDFPLSQSMLADAIGISNVHVNRILRELRRDGLISLRSGKLEVRSWEGLVQAGVAHLPGRDVSAVPSAIDQGQPQAAPFLAHR